jgi:hypothetical protein
MINQYGCPFYADFQFAYVNGQCLTNWSYYTMNVRLAMNFMLYVDKLKGVLMSKN